MAIDLMQLLGSNALTYLLQKIKGKTDELESAIEAKSDFSGDYDDLTNKPESLKNPYAVTFTGGATGSYDGSSALTVNIPAPTGLAAATETELGGIQAAAKTAGDTVPAKIGLDNILYVPTYPTKLPASDVYDWAKAETKPTYTPTEVGVIDTAPTDGQVAVFDGTTGKIHSTGFTIEKSVPSDAVFTDTTYTVMRGASASAAGASGLVPTPSTGQQERYLRGDGTWQTPPNTTYADATSSNSGLMPAADKAKLDAFQAASNYALKSDISTVYRYKGSLDDESGLPVSDQEVGDTYNLVSSTTYGDGANVAWNGTAWDDLGGTVDLSAYVEESELGEIGNSKIDSIWNSVFAS